MNNFQYSTNRAYLNKQNTRSVLNIKSEDENPNTNADIECALRCGLRNSQAVMEDIFKDIQNHNANLMDKSDNENNNDVSSLGTRSETIQPACNENDIIDQLLSKPSFEKILIKRQRFGNESSQAASAITKKK